MGRFPPNDFPEDTDLNLPPMRVFIRPVMSVRPIIFGAVLLASVAPASWAFAQDEAAADPAPAETPEGTLEEEESDGFPIRRGFYASGDFGGYFSFGGRNTNLPPTFPSRSVSNFQPVVALTLGFDVVSSPSINWAVGLRVGAVFNAGSGRLTEADIAALGAADASTAPADYDLGQAGLASKLGFMVADRLAVNIVADVGAAFVGPDPSLPATDPNGGSTAIGVQFGAGPGIEFFTLFPGFSIGLEAKFVGTIAASTFTPGISISAPLKYNF